MTPETLWRAESVGTTSAAKRHLLSLFPAEAPFDTPKPEELLARILSIATDDGDIVVDPYLGSGTTASVAHKMGRRYVGIERGESAVACAVRRLQLVVAGESGGISSAVDWCGGGTFAYRHLRTAAAFAA